MMKLIRSAMLAGLALMGVASLSACQTAPGNLAGLGTDGMSMVVVHANPNRPQGPQITDGEYKEVRLHVKSCLHDVRQQQSGVVETMVTNGGLDSFSGYLGGVGSETSQAAVLSVKVASKFVTAAGVGTAAVTGAQGVVNGAKIKSGAVTGIVGQCANGDLHDPSTARLTPEIHVYGSVIRTSNSSHGYPSWVKRTSDPFKGSPAGKPDLSNPDDHGGN
jgi:hypothetical protein